MLTKLVANVPEIGEPLEDCNAAAAAVAAN
jgi:hypothetical protein